jgi:hypothetical protein
VRLFFSYFGSKIKMSRYYGAPRREHVIEPFGGAAGYSTCWEPRRVTLIDKDPVIVGVWRFLQRASPSELMALPSNISSVDQLPGWVCQEAKWLIGFWCNHGLAQPAARRGNWARQARLHRRFWSKTIKARLAAQVERIRHWQIIEGDYSDAPDVDAHWHIDPPYQRAGKSYSYHGIDYQALSEWCRARRSFAQVCEAGGADWLPFEPLAEIHTHRYRNGHVSREAIFELQTTAGPGGVRSSNRQMTTLGRKSHATP